MLAALPDRNQPACVMEMEIPLGLFFQPFDYDLVRFLFEFVTGTNNSEGLIHEEDIFGDKEPWELIRYGPSENMTYFLTKLKKKSKSKTGCRVERTVGKKVKGKKPGNWHGQDKGKPVFDEKGKHVMGYKRCFVYKNRTEPEQDGQWLMKEFSLPETIVKKARAAYPIVEERKDFVLCRVERKKDEEDEDEDDEKTTLEKGGKDLEVETPSPPIITPSLSPSPSPVADDDINSNLIGVPVEETLALTKDAMNSFLASSLAAAADTDGGHDHNISSYFDGIPVPAPVPMGDTDIISSYLDDVPVPVHVPVGDTNIISSYLDGVPVPVPVPVGDTDIISSYLDGVPVPVPAGDTDISSYFDSVPVLVPVGDTDIISSYLDGVPVPVPVGDTDIISSYLDGVPVPVPAGDTDISSYFDGVPVPVQVGDTNLSSYLDGVPVPVPAGDTDMNSYLVDVPMETLIVPGETSAQADRDQDHHMRPDVAVETFPEPGSSSFMDFIFNMEDVTRKNSKSMGDSSVVPQLSTIDAFNCKKQLAGNGKLWPEEEEIVFLRSLGWEENGDDYDGDEEEGYLTQEEFATLSATTNGGDAFDCKKQLAGNGKLWPEDEEIAFLRSLGWEENGDDYDDDEEEGYITQEEFVTLSDEEEGYITQEEFVTLSATTNGGDAFNCKKQLGNHELCLEEEEIAFLRSLGWEESGDEDDEEGALTEEEIATFYTYVSNHILHLKPKPALRFTRLHHNTAVFSFFH
nr:NAC domain-containing protein [Ipomoea batatas]